MKTNRETELKKKFEKLKTWEWESEPLRQAAWQLLIYETEGAIKRRECSKTLLFEIHDYISRMLF